MTKVGQHLLSCPVCGGTMNRVRVLPSPSGSLVRYKCTCGHCEDRKAADVPPNAKGGDDFSMDGFEEMP